MGAINFLGGVIIAVTSFYKGYSSCSIVNGLDRDKPLKKSVFSLGLIIGSALIMI